MRLIWLTRGHSWGFRFLRLGGFEEALTVYDLAFQRIRDEREGFDRIFGSASMTDMAALRFKDPEGRKDRAGRVIPHDFVVFPPEVQDLDSFDAARGLVWNTVADEYAELWERDRDPREQR